MLKATPPSSLRICMQQNESEIYIFGPVCTLSFQVVLSCKHPKTPQQQQRSSELRYARPKQPFKGGFIRLASQFLERVNRLRSLC